VDGYLVDLVAQVDRLEGRIKRNRRTVEELVADAAHGHITIERMKALGADLATEHQELEGELRAARERLQAQESEAERRKHLEGRRDELVREWDSLPFETLQASLRDVVDRVEVDGEDVRVYLRV
jgi:predicted  nucleic acid-binding Zn-ribbon protein